MKFKSKTSLALRLLSLPFYIPIILLVHLVGAIVVIYRFFMYGGEFKTYDKDDHAMISKIYDELKLRKNLEEETLKNVRKKMMDEADAKLNKE